jgi:hypothetical protein
MGFTHRPRRSTLRTGAFRIAAAGLLLCFMLVPAIARADESSAEQLFQEGLAAMKRSDFAVACEAFAQSNKADASPGTQINLAVCFEKRKLWASAWTWYRSAVGLAQQRGQKEREQLAEESANRLRPQLHYLVIAVSEPLTEPIVKRDGNEVTIAVAGKELPLPVDPGKHKIEVSARGKRPWSKVVEVADNAQTERVEVGKLEDAPVADNASASAGPNSRPVIVGNDGSGQRTVGIVVGAAGVLAGLAAGGVFIVAKNEESERDKQYEAANGKSGAEKDALDKSAQSHASAAENNQLISLILGGGAVVLVGVGVVLFVTAPKNAEKAAKPRVTPLVGPGFAGLGFGGTF